MKIKKSISREFFTKFVLVTFITILIFGFIDIRKYYVQYKINVKEIHDQFIKAQEDQIKSEVDRVVFFIQEMIKHSKRNGHDLDSLQNEILREIVNFRFAEQGYFFGATVDGGPLFSNGKITKGGASIKNLTDKRGTKIFQQYLQAIENPEGDFITYYWNKIDETVPKAKLSFLKYVPEWEWIIGAGLYYEDMSKQMAEKISFMKQEVQTKIFRLIGFTLFLIIVSFFIAKLISQRIRKEFDVFINAFQNPEENYKDIDPEKMRYDDIALLAESTRKMLNEQIRSKSELFEKELQLRNIMNINPHFIFVKNRKGKFLLANKATAEVYGLTPEKLEGKTDAEVAPSRKEAQKFREDDLLILKGKREKVTQEETISDKKGNTRYLYTIKKPIKMSSEKGICVLGISIDITELKKAQKELEIRNEELRREMKQRSRAEESLKDSRTQLFSIIKNSTNVFYTHTSKHQITYISPQIEKILGYTANEALRVWTELASDHPANKKALELTEKALKTGETQEPYEIELVHKNGSKVWVEAHEAPVKSGDSMIIVGSLTDITARKTAQKELEKHKDNLEKMVMERTKELQDQNKKYALTQKALSYLMDDINEMRTEVEETNEQLIYANKELESFSYSVSHDLRAPLRAINGFATILGEEYGEVLDDQAFEYLDIVKDNATQMSNLINDLLEFSRVSRKDIKGDKFNIYKEFDSVFNELAKHHPDKNIELKLHDMVEVHADRKMIRQVIHNLISNAIKYSSKEEKIFIEIGMNEKAKEYEFYIKDNGVGFNEEYRNKLFGVFQRLHTPEEFEGTGVGLAIVKRIILKHRGKVRAEAVEDEGATFYFSLPKHFKQKEDQMTQEEINMYAKELLELEDNYKDIFEEALKLDDDL
ncbi:MAG: PAS domain S-box protein [Candidatus Cloacimonetes bacterium]|nr:PAS domain S-box protein [Candidatus Cloacimonadota bacterium]MCF7815366.1 PAS domain S-box protein [Candidatus Cloacimonadota bacterium]MCF7868540.1 PAS domain S-box protein [Candidatus Cloacimonadota bacterium]MCF7884040.1 PAS domain S-box protein [Candidatus Cloacimonadota bacterium]